MVTPVPTPATAPEATANDLIAQALQNAGVPPRNIELPPEVVAEPAKVPSPDGLPKGEVLGESPEEKATREAAEAAKVAVAKAQEPSEPKPGEKGEQPLGKAEIETAITEASSKFQSIMDRKINQITYQMRQTVDALNQFFQTQEDASLSGLSGEELVQKRLERLEKPGGPKIQIKTDQPVEQQAAQFYQYLANFVAAVGLKIDDKRIDWAPDVDDPKAGFNRFLVSIKTALVADQTTVIKELKDAGDAELAKLRKKTGVDKVSITGPGGSGIPDMSKLSAAEKIALGFQIQDELSQAAGQK